jgi:hypothetical protein
VVVSAGSVVAVVAGAVVVVDVVDVNVGRGVDDSSLVQAAVRAPTTATARRGRVVRRRRPALMGS